MSLTYPVTDTCTCTLSDLSGGLYPPPGINAVIDIVQYSTTPSSYTTTFSGPVYGMSYLGDGDYGVAVHTDEACSSTTHFDSFYENVHGILNAETAHLGDLNNITVSGGDCTMNVECTRLQIDTLDSPATESCVGMFLAIHQAPDDTISQPDGNMGLAVSSGVIGTDYDYDVIVRISRAAGVTGEIKATAPLKAQTATAVKGSVDFHQMEATSPGTQKPTAIAAAFTNMNPTVTYGLTIDRYNGGPVMVDLGTNFTITPNGDGTLSIPASTISLLGTSSVIGRSLRLTQNGQTIMKTPIGVKKIPNVRVSVVTKRIRK